MHLKRRTVLVGGEGAGRAGTLRPLSSPASRLMALTQRDEPPKVGSAEHGRLSAVLSDMAEQVRRLATSVESLRDEIS